MYQITQLLLSSMREPDEERRQMLGQKAIHIRRIRALQRLKLPPVNLQIKRDLHLLRPWMEPTRQAQRSDGMRPCHQEVCCRREILPRLLTLTMPIQ